MLDFHYCCNIIQCAVEWYALPGGQCSGAEEHVGHEEAQDELHAKVCDGGVAELVPGTVPAIRTFVSQGIRLYVRFFLLLKNGLV